MRMMNEDKNGPGNETVRSASSMDRIRLGALGEEAAVRHLMVRGYRIIERNWRCRLGEIDIIAMDGEELVIVEVRTKSRISFGTGAESVNLRKQRKLRQLALAFIHQHEQILNLSEVNVRFDVISVMREEGGRLRIDHIVHAF